MLWVMAYVYRVGQNRLYTPHMAVYLVVLLQTMPYIHRICMVLAKPAYVWRLAGSGRGWGIARGKLLCTNVKRVKDLLYRTQHLGGPST
jgi:hypothetical protein